MQQVTLEKDLVINEFIYNSFVFVTLGCFGIAGLEKFAKSREGLKPNEKFIINFDDYLDDCTNGVNGQDEKKKDNVFTKFYDNFFKYATVYGAGDYRAPYESSDKKYLIRTPDGAGIYDVPEVVDVTEYFPSDYRIGFGIRKLGRFGYERKPGNFWTGDQNLERQNALIAPTSAVQGWEYLFHFEKERRRGEEWENLRYFLRHTGKYHIVKLEQRYQGAFDFNYSAAEVRGRLPIGKKFSISAGAAFRTHERVYGVNPYEIWVSALDADGNQENYWYELAYEYGYQDAFYTTTILNPVTGQEQNTGGYFWWDPEGRRIASSDLQFRDGLTNN